MDGGMNRSDALKSGLVKQQMSCLELFGVRLLQRLTAVSLRTTIPPL